MFLFRTIVVMVMCIAILDAKEVDSLFGINIGHKLNKTYVENCHEVTPYNLNETDGQPFVECSIPKERLNGMYDSGFVLTLNDYVMTIGMKKYYQYNDRDACLKEVNSIKKIFEQKYGFQFINDKEYVDENDLAYKNIDTSNVKVSMRCYVDNDDKNTRFFFSYYSNQTRKIAVQSIGNEREGIFQ